MWNFSMMSFAMLCYILATASNELNPINFTSESATEDFTMSDNTTQNQNDTGSSFWNILNLLSRINPLAGSNNETTRWRLLDTGYWNPFAWIGRSVNDISLKLAAKALGHLLSIPLTNDSQTVTDVNYWNAKYLRKMKRMDVDDCLARLVCEVARDEKEYGVLGERLAKFFQVHHFAADNSSAGWWFSKAFEIGQGSREPKTINCQDVYHICKRNITQLFDVATRKLKHKLTKY